MKNKWKFLYNPFERIAGWKAFGIGITILAITTIAGYFGNTVFYGLSVKSVLETTLSSAFLLQALGLAVTVGVMYIVALISAKHVRFQDILGTVALAKYPLLLLAILSLPLGPKIATIDVEAILHNWLAMPDLAILVVFGILSIIVVVWEVALLYNAFKVSTNLRSRKCVALFIISLLISEFITLILKNLLV
ncbi:MAG: hypothetical protein LBR45_02605 [Bacteroidales bacterium]|jgi:hypothetical protein|nr:hypothetical protein [Bacteroidales bacterium]